LFYLKAIEYNIFLVSGTSAYLPVVFIILTHLLLVYEYIISYLKVPHERLFLCHFATQ